RYLELWNLRPEALALLDEAGLARLRLQDCGEPEALVGRAQRARLLAELSRPAEARSELDDAQALALALPAAESRRPAVVHELARGWLAVGEFKRAEPLFVEELGLLKVSPKAGDPRPALKMLADLCDADGRAADAAQWRDRLAALSSGEANR